MFSKTYGILESPLCLFVLISGSVSLSLNSLLGLSPLPLSLSPLSPLPLNPILSTQSSVSLYRVRAAPPPCSLTEYGLCFLK